MGCVETRQCLNGGNIVWIYGKKNGIDCDVCS